MGASRVMTPGPGGGVLREGEGQVPTGHSSKERPVSCDYLEDSSCLCHGPCITRKF